MKNSILHVALAAIAALCASGTETSAAWEPVRPVEFIVPAGTGGGADQMARTIQGIVTKHNLMKQPMVVINKAGGAGGEGFLDVKGSSNNPHKIIITLSNLFTTPLATGIPFNWKDLTPVAMLALDEFVLWVNAEKSKQEDQIITVAVEKAIDTKFTYIPYKGGGEVAVQLVGNHVDSTVNNPIEAVAQWRGGKLRPLCVFDAQPMAYDEPIADGKSWKDIPTCKSQGLEMEYLMLRGIFMPPKATKDQVEYYVELFKKVRATPEWQDFMKSGAFNTTFLTGADYAKWVEAEQKRHEVLMKEAGFLASGN
jgi:putative tricarboxylic transport membrane protein